MSTAAKDKLEIVKGSLIALMLINLELNASGQSSSPVNTDRAALIANAESAGPEEITKHATILGWPSKMGDDFVLIVRAQMAGLV
jgi:hypothetical protein